MSRRKFPRRKHARADFDWPVTVAASQSTIHGQIKNISRSGALVYMPEELNLHEHIRLAVEIPEFGDVISAKGEVVRTFSVKTGHQCCSFGVGIKFTEILDEDLRYFTGNLAPEWREDHEDSSILPRSRSSYMNKILYGLAAIFLVFVSFYVLQFVNNDQIERNRIVGLDNRINLLEEQVAAFKTRNSYGINLDDQLSKIQSQLIDMQGKLANFVTVEKLQHEVKNFETKFKGTNRPVELSEKTEQIIHLNKTKQATPLYYYIKKGDSLYSIGTRHSISVDRIRALNSFSQNELIHSGQKIIIGWK